MKTIYVGFDGTRMECEQQDIEVRIPVIFRYYNVLDSFSLFINPEPNRFIQMEKNLKRAPHNYKYAVAHLVCPTKEFSNPDAWEVEGIEDLDDDFRERLTHYWEGFTGHWFSTYCSENTRLWRGDTTTLDTKFYLNDTIISEGNNCTFIMSGDSNGIRFSKLSNVLIHILGDYYEVD